MIELYLSSIIFQSFQPKMFLFDILKRRQIYPLGGVLNLN